MDVEGGRGKEEKNRETKDGNRVQTSRPLLASRAPSRRSR